MKDSQVDLRSIGIKAPPIPASLDIIPIHTSDRAEFKRCRRRWHWVSPMRSKLRAKVQIGGVVMPLWFGTGIHYALEQYYDPFLRRDPVETFQTWWELSWHGGHVSEDEHRLTYDPNPYKAAYENFWRVKGLEELLPDPDKYEFEEHRELGIGMLTFYREWAEANDNFAVIAAEHEFSVPLGFDAIDPRDGYAKPVHYRGRMDAIVQDLDSGRYGIIDHKTAARVDEDYFRKLEKDEQCTSYMYAAQREAEIYDLPYKQIDFVIYNTIRKTYPKPPTMTTRGLPSLDRQNESTTYEMFATFIDENNLQLWFDSNEKAQGYANYLQEAGDEVFIQRNIVRRNQAEIVSADWRIGSEAREMLNVYPEMLMGDRRPNSALFPNPTGDYICLNCQFRAPCIAFDDGSDWQSMISEGYEKDVSR